MTFSAGCDIIFNICIALFRLLRPAGGRQLYIEDKREHLGIPSDRTDLSGIYTGCNKIEDMVLKKG